MIYIFSQLFNGLRRHHFNNKVLLSKALSCDKVARGKLTFTTNISPRAQFKGLYEV